MESKKCVACGRTIPLESFRKTRWGGVTSTCKECIAENIRASKYENRNKVTSNVDMRYSDPEFDGKQPVEVIQIMSRAKRWLEAQGYTITLKGEYREVKVRPIKFLMKQSSE